MTNGIRWSLLAMVALAVVGCASTGTVMEPDQEVALRRRAVEGVKRAVRYEHSGRVRALGIEVMQRRLGEDGLAWIRNAVRDREPGVRFAAILALGKMRDNPSYAAIVDCTHDKDDNLKVAAYFALHRMGDTSYTGRLPEMLLEHPNADVRRSAALVLGLMEEPKALKLLARAMGDRDQSVKQQALESMALLRSPEAIQQLTFAAGSGLGYERVTALSTLAELADRSLENTFRYQLKEGEFIDTRLAAARGLGLLRNKEGYDVAYRALGFNTPQKGVSSDPPDAQIRRVRQAAAVALGAMGDRRALSELSAMLDDPSDPWLQVVAADAVLEILKSDGDLPGSSDAFRGSAGGG